MHARTRPPNSEVAATGCHHYAAAAAAPPPQPLPLPPLCSRCRSCAATDATVTTSATVGTSFSTLFTTVTYFLDFAYTNSSNIQRQIIEGKEVFLVRCPCAKCKNQYHKRREVVEYDLCKNGFMDNNLT
ncbi:hypothetical protein L1987_52693 [Smallanthus sonchifolius]|uniref:Uncharacterized protein n=1 Tax=Smallanthus sonchifolius TaxID=185202 RepID=A0ACB9EUG2_9ASTR|nr:hypothetical protein L1987_52693 [Smallanthus sonchifolius]